MRNVLYYTRNDYSCITSLFFNKSVIKEEIFNTRTTHYTDEECATVGVIRELIKHRDRVIDVPLSLNDVNALLQSICTG